MSVVVFKKMLQIIQRYINDGSEIFLKELCVRATEPDNLFKMAQLAILRAIKRVNSSDHSSPNLTILLLLDKKKVECIIVANIKLTEIFEK